MNARDNVRWAALNMLGGAFFATLQSALMKDLSGTFSAYMVVFVRFCAPLAIIVIVLLASRHLRVNDFKTQVLGLHFLRACIVVVGIYALFYSLMHLPLMDANLLRFTSPLFIPLLASVFLGEKTERRLWVWIGVSFVGVVLVLKPGRDIFTPASFIGLASGLALAASMTILRRLTKTDNNRRCVFYNLALGTVIAAMPLAVVGWEHVPVAHYTGIKGGATAEIFVLLGISASLTQVFLTKANRLAPVPVTGPFVYATIPLSALADWLFWHHVPDAMTIAGAIVLITGAVMIMRGGKAHHAGD